MDNTTPIKGLSEPLEESVAPRDRGTDADHMPEGRWTFVRSTEDGTTFVVAFRNLQHEIHIPRDKDSFLEQANENERRIAASLIDLHHAWARMYG